MSFSNQNSMRVTIQQLKEIVTSIQGEDNETSRLIQQMEDVVSEIERKSAPFQQSSVTSSAAPAPVIA